MDKFVYVSWIGNGLHGLAVADNQIKAQTQIAEMISHHSIHVVEVADMNGVAMKSVSVKVVKVLVNQ